MTVDPLESNTNCSWYSSHGESMWNILHFEIAQKKSMFLMWPLGGLFLALQLGLLEFGLYLMVMYFFLANSVVGTIRHLILNLSSLESL